MNKYNLDFKKKVVQEYLNGTMGTKSLAKKYGIPSNKTIRVWVASFKTYGEQALKPMVKPRMYSSQNTRLAVSCQPDALFPCVRITMVINYACGNIIHHKTTVNIDKIVDNTIICVANGASLSYLAARIDVVAPAGMLVIITAIPVATTSSLKR